MEEAQLEVVCGDFVVVEDVDELVEESLEDEPLELEPLEVDESPVELVFDDESLDEPDAGALDDSDELSLPRLSLR